MKYVIAILIFLLPGCKSDKLEPSKYFIVRNIEIENEQIVRYTARAIERRRFGDSFPFGYESWKVVDRY